MKSFVIFTFLLACPFIYGQALLSPLPLHKDAIEGRLENGLHYIIHRNPIPSHKVELRMVLNVGAILENEEENGISHFIEHMMFNGTHTFPGDAAVRILKQMGIKYGYDINAFTGYDETIYILPIPTDNETNLDTALDIYRSWLTELEIRPADVEKEKKIVVQEIRDTKEADPFYTAKVSNSRYIERPVLGTENNVAAFDSAAIRRYYDRWYRPDLVTIIAVGDIDTQTVKTKIEERFAGLKPKGEIVERKRYSLPLKGAPVIKQVQNELIPSDKLEVFFPVGAITATTYNDARQQLLEQLFSRMLNKRLKNSSINCDYSYNWYLDNVAHRVFTLEEKNGEDVFTALGRLARTLAQIRQYGFSRKEIEYTFDELLAFMTDRDIERTSQSYCDDYVEYAVNGDKRLTDKAKYQFYSACKSTISSDDFNDLIASFLTPDQRMLLCHSYAGPISKLPDEEHLMEIWHGGFQVNSLPYTFKEEKRDVQNEVKPVEMIIDVPSAASIISEKHYPAIGVTELLLSNKLKVALRPTQNEESEIMISLNGRGGFSLLPMEEYPFLSDMAAYIDMSGAGNLSPKEFECYCKEKNIALSTNIDNYYHEIYGVAFQGDMESLLKAIYARIVDIKENRNDFIEAINAEMGSIGKVTLLQKQMEKDMERAVDRLIAHYSGNTHKCYRELSTKEDFEHIDLDRIIAHYQQLFQRSNDLVAVISGNFDINEMKACVTRYLGMLPMNKSEIEIQDLGYHFPSGITHEVVPVEECVRTNTTILYHGTYNHSLRETIKLKMMHDILSNHMINSLREKEGLVYSPYALVTYRAFPVSEFFFEINYYSDEQSSEYLEKCVNEEIKKLQTNHISQEELNSIKRAFLIAKRESLTAYNTPAWRNKLKEMYLENQSLTDFEMYDEILNKISVEEIRTAFERLIDLNRYMVISLKTVQTNP